MASQYRRRSLMLNTIAKIAQGNPTIITDSSSRRLKRLDIFGQSKQASTTGAQLLNLPTGTFTNEEGQSFKVNDDMTVDVNSPAFESGYHDVTINLETPIDVVQGQTNLRLFFEGNISSFASFFLVDDVGNIILSIALGTSYTGIANKTGRATKFYYRQQNTGGVIAKGLKFMVSQSSITDYEPYTGGKPSPSPDYPQEIISKEVSQIKVRGKNKLPFPFRLFKEEKKINGLTFTPLEDGGIKLNGNCTDPTIINLDKYPYDNKYKCTLWNTNGTPYQMGKNSIQMAHDFNNDFIYIYIETVGTVFNDLIVYPMESLVSMSNTYEPYKEQKITLSEPITLRGIPVESGGNVTIDGQQYISDVICEKDGVIGVERNPKELIFDGSEDENWILSPVAESIYSYRIELSDAKRFAGINVTLLCNRGFYISDSDVGSCFMYLYTESISNPSFYFIPEQSIESAEQFKEYLATDNLKLVYLLETPTFEPLPEEVQAQYKALKSYYPNTVIQTGCWNEVTYSAKRGG